MGKNGGIIGVDTTLERIEKAGESADQVMVCASCECARNGAEHVSYKAGADMAL